MPTPTTRTLLQLRQDVLSRISENNNSPVGQLPSGTDSTPTEGTNAAVTRYLNEGGRRLARAAYPLIGAATFTPVVGTSFVPFNSFSTTDGSGLWAPRVLTQGGVRIPRAERSYLEINTTQTKTLWNPEGPAGVTLSNITATTAITATGFIVPPLMVADSDTPAWLEPDLDYLLVDYAAAEMCRKAMPVDPALGGLANMWGERFERGVIMQNVRLRETDMNLWKAHFQIAPPLDK